MNSVLLLFLRRMRLPLLVLLMVYAISIGGMVLVPGQDDAGNPWRMDFFHALYFVSYMGSTIGFGELPYPFTPAQRLWVLVCIYMTVIGWLYAVGSILRLLSDTTFQNAITEARLARQVKRLHEPFYIICGYGQSGSLLVRSLARRGIHTVVIDNNAEHIAEISIQSDLHDIPYLVGDASLVHHLKEAGVQSPWCFGVVGVTDNDDVNVKVAITAKLLNPLLKVVCRAGTQEAVANLESFETDRIVNPFNSFSDHLVMSIERPSVNRLHTLLGSLPGRPFPRPIQPPNGHWIIVGYGRFGQALHRYFSDAGIAVTIIENNPDLVPDFAIHGLGVDEDSLKAAGVEHAAGLVAGSDKDADNLSIIVTARRLNPELYLVARQNYLSNREVFDAAHLDLVMDVNRIIVWRVLPFLSTRYLYEFLKQTRAWSEATAHDLVKQIEGVSGGRTPACWCQEISSKQAPAVLALLESGHTVTLKALMSEPNDPELMLPVMALVRVRGGEMQLLPDINEPIEKGDHYLFTGQQIAESAMCWLMSAESELRYLVTGKRIASSIVLRFLLGQKL